MQKRPDPSELLDAVAQFLLADVHPTVQDKALAFRVLIAANLATVVASELRTEDQRYTAETARLAALLPGVAAPLAGTRKERARTLDALDRALAARLRSNEVRPEDLRAIHAHLDQTARETLAVTNPRFDTSGEIE